MDGLTKRAPRTRTHAAYSRIVSARTRSHAYARTHRRTHLHTWVLHRYMYTHIVPEVCVGYIYRRAHTHDVAGRILGVRNCPHVHMDTMRPRSRSQPKASHKYTSIYRYRTPSIATYRHTPMYTHMARSTRTRALAPRALVPTKPTGDPYGSRRSINTRAWLYIDWAATRRELPEPSVRSALPSPQHEPAAACAHTANMRIHVPSLRMRADIHGSASIRH
jgi:hypothetical protein